MRRIFALVFLLATFGAAAADEERAPLPIAPESGSVFVDADIRLAWTWHKRLEGNQRFALRIWTDDKPYYEVWTDETELAAKRIIDSFSLDLGKFYWQAIVVNLDADGAYESLGSAWSEVAVLRRLRRQPIAARPAAELSDMAKHLRARGLGASELIDAVHLFIHQNSATNNQAIYAPDFSDAAQLMYEHAQGLIGEKPEIQCDGRSTAMLTILRELGIESRLVFLYASGPGWLSEHTVLEVFNPDTQYWQTHDLGGDVYYYSAEVGVRVNAESLLFDDHEGIVGCPVDGGPCSAELSAPGLAYFGALRYGHTFDVWVNPDRFDLSARFKGQDNQNLAEWIGEDQPRRVTFRMDSWLDSK